MGANTGPRLSSGGELVSALTGDLARTIFTLVYFGALGYGIGDLIAVGHRRKAAR